MKYSIKRSFKLWLYTVSHSTLIIRSERQYPDVDYDCEYSPNTTIDIVFSGVDYIALPDQLEEVEIQKLGNKFVFNENEDGFVIASNCIIATITEESENDMWPKFDQILKDFNT
jgi:hypothetical protein